MKSRGFGGTAELAPRPAEELGQDIAAGQRGLQCRAKRRGNDPDNSEGHQQLSPCSDDGHHRLRQRGHVDLTGQRDDRRAGRDSDRQKAAEWQADYYIEPRRAQILGCPMFLDRAG